MKKLLFVLLITFASIQVLFAESENLDINDQFKITAKSQHEEDANLHYTIDAKFPQIEGDKLSSSAKQFNKKVSEMVNQEISQFKKYVNEDKAHMQNLPEDVRHNNLNIDYKINVINPAKQTIIAVRLQTEGMQAGRAHPYHKTEVLNFNFTNGRTIALRELFKPGSHYLNLIANIAKKNLGEKVDDKMMLAEGTKPVDKNFKNWMITSDGILIIFDEYQVAPYSFGQQEVKIPCSALCKLISPNSVVCGKNPA